MAKNRAGAEKFIKTYIEKIAGAGNRKIYDNLFSKMTDKDFDTTYYCRYNDYIQNNTSSGKKSKLGGGE